MLVAVRPVVPSPNTGFGGLRSFVVFSFFGDRTEFNCPTSRRHRTTNTNPDMRLLDASSASSRVAFALRFWCTLTAHMRTHIKFYVRQSRTRLCNNLLNSEREYSKLHVFLQRRFQTSEWCKVC